VGRRAEADTPYGSGVETGVVIEHLGPGLSRGVVALFLSAVAGTVSGCGPDPAVATRDPHRPAQATVAPLESRAPAATPTAPSSALAPDGPTVKARVVRVIDGDTIVVDIKGKQYHLRYIGMDTPESVKPDTPVQPMALAASAANKTLVEGKTVLLEKDVSETDRFGRLLRDVWVERDGRLVLVGLELVRTGYANVTTFPPDVKYVDQLLAALGEARAAGRGLWAPGTAP
jgi:micrococcal nuclease